MDLRVEKSTSKVVFTGATFRICWTFYTCQHMPEWYMMYICQGVLLERKYALEMGGEMHSFIIH